VNFAPTLVIDGNGGAGKQLAEQLKHAGFAADTVDSCGAALTAARSGHYGSMIFVGDLSQRTTYSVLLDFVGKRLASG
jgi:DNA-binding response OmpR family regulator